MAKNEMVSLGLLYPGPRHTYALDAFVKRMGLEEWGSISRASVYNTLQRLESQGCVTVTTERVGKMPERKIYQITEKGKQRLLEELRENMLSPSTGDNPLFLAMSFNFGMSADEAIEILEKRIEMLNNMIEGLKRNYEELRKWNVHHSMIMINAALKYMELEIETTKDFIGLLRENPDYFNKDLLEMYRAMTELVRVHNKERNKYA